MTLRASAFVFAYLCSCIANAQSQSSATPATERSSPFQATTLETGLDIVSLESPKVPLVTITLVAKAGAMTETPDINGLTHLWEHMFFKGNARIPNQEAFNRRVRELGIVFNGDTSAEMVRYYFTLPSTFLEEGLQFMADAIATPLLEQAELERERVVVLDEFDRAASNPAFDLWRLERSIVYGSQAHLRDPLGPRPVIEKATREQLLRIKGEVFVPANCALVVTGDINHKKLTELAKKHFGSWINPRGWKPIKPAPFPPFPKTTEFVMARPHVENAQVLVTFEGPRARAQPKDTFAADVLISLLNHRSGKFFAKFIDSGITFGSGLGYHTQSQAGQLRLFAESKPESIQSIRSALLAEIPEWTKEDYFSADELADVRRSLVINHKREINKPSEYGRTLAFWWAVTGLEYYDNYLRNLRSIELADVRQFVQRWLIDKPYVSSILLSPDGAKAAGLEDSSSSLMTKHLGSP